MYRIAGNFRGVLIFVIFVTIPRVTKFSTHEIFHPRIFSRLLRIGLRKSRNLKPRKLILKTRDSFSRKFAPPKITRYTVFEAKFIYFGCTLHRTLKTSIFHFFRDRLEDIYFFTSPPKLLKCLNALFPHISINVNSSSSIHVQLDLLVMAPQLRVKLVCDSKRLSTTSTIFRVSCLIHLHMHTHSETLCICTCDRNCSKTFWNACLNCSELLRFWWKWSHS